MGTNFGRTCSVALEGGSGRTINGGGDRDLRIAFHVFQSTIQTPNAAEVFIYNPAPATIQQFQHKEFKKLTLTAGYHGTSGVIYKGDIKGSIYRHEDNVTTYIKIFCADGDTAYNQAIVNTTLAKGYTPQDKVNAAVKAMSPFGMSLGLVNVDLSKPAYPRGVPLFSLARDILREVALSAGATWSMQQGQLHIVDERKPVSGNGVIVLNSKTGMIGWPEQTEGGIVVKSLINPALKVHSKVQINESSIQQADIDYQGLTSDVSQRTINLAQTGQISNDGTYLVYFLEREGDTRQNEPWFDTSTVIATGATPNQAQSQMIPAWTVGQS